MESIGKWVNKLRGRCDAPRPLRQWADTKQPGTGEDHREIGGQPQPVPQDDSSPAAPAPPTHALPAHLDPHSPPAQASPTPPVTESAEELVTKIAEHVAAMKSGDFKDFDQHVAACETALTRLDFLAEKDGTLHRTAIRLRGEFEEKKRKSEKTNRIFTVIGVGCASVVVLVIGLVVILWLIANFAS